MWPRGEDWRSTTEVVSAVLMSGKSPSVRGWHPREGAQECSPPRLPSIAAEKFARIRVYPLKQWVLVTYVVNSGPTEASSPTCRRFDHPHRFKAAIDRRRIQSSGRKGIYLAVQRPRSAACRADRGDRRLAISANTLRGSAASASAMRKNSIRSMRLCPAS